MKAFIAICMLAMAAAEPEADPQLLYANTFGGYAGYNGYNSLGLRGYAAGFTGLPTTYSGFGYPYANGYSNYYGARVFKRDAESKAEADPAFFYSGLHTPYNYGFNGYNAYNGISAYNALPYAHAFAPSVYHHAAPAAIPAVPGAYAAAGRYVANSGGVVHVAKRSADAEADAKADPFLLYGGAYNNFNAYNAYAGYPYAARAAYTTPYAYGAYAGAYSPYTAGRYFF